MLAEGSEKRKTKGFGVAARKEVEKKVKETDRKKKTSQWEMERSKINETKSE